MDLTNAVAFHDVNVSMEPNSSGSTMIARDKAYLTCA